MHPAGLDRRECRQVQSSHLMATLAVVGDEGQVMKPNLKHAPVAIGVDAEMAHTTVLVTNMNEVS